jgi:hypothetical protein
MCVHAPSTAFQQDVHLRAISADYPFFCAGDVLILSLNKFPGKNFSFLLPTFEHQQPAANVYFFKSWRKTTRIFDYLIKLKPSWSIFVFNQLDLKSVLVCILFTQKLNKA